MQSIEHQVCSPIAGREHADQFGAAHGVAGGRLETQAICQRSASNSREFVADCVCILAAALASQAGATQQAVSMDCARCWTSVSCFFCSFIKYTQKGVNSTVSKVLKITEMNRKTHLRGCSQWQRPATRRNQTEGASRAGLQRAAAAGL